MYVFMCSEYHNVVCLYLGQLGVATSLLDMKADDRDFSAFAMLTLATGCYLR